MGKVLIMDHTLQEGGYVCNWSFGKQVIHDIVDKLTDCHVDIIDLGYLRDEKPSAHRTVYPSVRRLSKQIGFKNRSTRYAVTIDMDEPIDADRLDERRDGIVDILCVTLRKGLIGKDRSYLQELSDKGYHLCIILTGIHLYTQQELASAIATLSPLAPFTLCLRDQFAALTSEQTAAYFDAADTLLPRGCDLAYWPVTENVYTRQAVRELASRRTERDIWIMVADMSRTMDMLPLHTLMDWPEAGGKLNRKAVVDLFDSIIRFLVDGTCSSIAVYAKRARQLGCDPDYAAYYCRDFALSSEDAEHAYKEAVKMEFLIYTKARAKKAIRAYWHRQWKEKLAVIIPTADRPEAIKYYLKTVISKFDDFGIDFIVYDSSSTDKTKKIVEEYQEEGYECLKYERYNGTYDGRTIDDKVIEAYRSHCDKYEYIWIMRDGLIINIALTAPKLYKYIKKEYDIIVMDEFSRDYSIETIEYTDCRKFFASCIHQMTVLGLTIVRSETIRRIIQEQPLDKTLNWGMWQPIAFFHYFANRPLTAISYVGMLYVPNLQARKSAFWTRNLLWQWAERWYTMVDLLPAVYTRYKPAAWRIGMADFHPFWPWFLVSARAYGGLTWKKYFQNRKYLPYVCDTATWKFVGTLLLPPRLCRRMIEKSDLPFTMFLRRAYRHVVKVYHALKG